MAAPERRRPCSGGSCSLPHNGWLAGAATAALLLLVLHVAPVAAQNGDGPVPNTLDINDSFGDFNFVPAGRALYYDFVAYNYTSQKVPDIQVTLKSSGGVDVALYLYCNPSWFSASSPENSVPRPTNAIFKSEESVLPNVITISSDDSIIRPESARIPDTAAFNNYVPAFNCSVVSNDPTQGTRFTIDVAFNYRNINIVAEERQALQGIWDLCCAREVNETTRRVVDTGDGSGLDNNVDELKCGRWAQNNDLYGGNALEPYLDFCQIAGNQCTNEGRLTKLDMSSYGLVCELPVDEFAKMTELKSLDLSDNFDIKGNLTDVFAALSNLNGLEVLDLSDAAGLQPPLVPPGEDPGDSGLCLLASRLSILNMVEIGLPGAELPACLFDSRSSIQELRIEFNSMTGTIPDVFTPESPLRVFSALNSGLRGAIPPSLSAAPELEILDLGFNYMNGTIPADIGASRYLRYLYLMNNELTGAIPESVALHEALESLDVSDNRLSALPAAWKSASTARIQASPLRNIKLSRNLFGDEFPGVFPLLPDLVLLHMDNNRFKGALPNVAGMFSQLRVFNATRNLLTGSIPTTFGAAGIFTLPQINALGIELLEEPAVANKDGVQSRPLRAQPQVFDVSANSISGAVPAFMYAVNVPDFVKPRVNVQYNKLTVRCSGAPPPVQLTYLGDNSHLCPQYPPPGALAGLGENTANGQPVGTTSAAAGDSGSSSDGNGGVPGWGGAIIGVVVFLVVAAIAAYVGLIYYRARARGERFKIAMLDPRSRRRGFKQFNDLEMTSGMDPLGFGPPSATYPNAQLNGHANGSTNGSTPVKPKRTKGGFL